MVSNWRQRIYGRVLALYPREFRERFGESMEQTFNDLCRERRRTAGIFFDTVAGILRERALQLTQITTVKGPNPKARTAAIISAILCVPPVILFSLMILNIEPPFAAALRGEPDVPNIPGSLIALFLMLLLPAAFLVSLRPIMLSRRAGNGIASSPANLMLAVVSASFFAFIVGSIIVDQYPCWIGVPNCD